MNNNVHFSSNDQTWTTPEDFYNNLNKEFNFTLDPCCTKSTAKCKKYFTPVEDGLKQEWGGETVFMNPPYGREIKQWIKKAYEESKIGATVVCLIPSRTDTSYWHNYIFKAESEGNCKIRFLRGRLKFGESKNSAPFPSAVVIFKKGINNEKYN
jgi:site-specific DNA-methyltransferase (adenine-specific)